MSKLGVHHFSLSLDGFGTGPPQGLTDPIGVGGMQLHEWVFARPAGRAMMGETNGADEVLGIDDAFIARQTNCIGATIIGRNMFGPIRVEWPGEAWTGWRGDEPPYHQRHARAHPPRTIATVDAARDEVPLHRRADRPRSRARVRCGCRRGHPARRRCVHRPAGPVRRTHRRTACRHVAMSATLLGAGERLFEGFADAIAGYECTEFVRSARTTHAVLTRHVI